MKWVLLKQTCILETNGCYFVKMIDTLQSHDAEHQKRFEVHRKIIQTNNFHGREFSPSDLRPCYYSSKPT